jgi:cytosine/adenosine deaminase-related metal-dependent hydrolase
MLFRSDFLFTSQNQILEDAALEIENEKIIAVGAASKILKSRKPDYDFKNSLVLPGLVNAHTHLDLSRFLNKIPAKLSFGEWVKRFLSIRAEVGYLNADEYGNRILEQASYGITTIGDINQSGAIANPTSVRVIAFLELLGLTEDFIEYKKKWFDDLLKIKLENVTYGVSPHAPYTTDASLFQKAHDSGLLQMIHLAESQSEKDFADGLPNDITPFLNASGFAPQNYKDQPFWQKFKSGQAIFVHGNYLSDDEIEKIKSSKSSVAICPRCWDYYGHIQNLWEKLWKENVNLCLGTDSLASNYSLNLHEEMIFLYENKYFQPQNILQMATLNGAKALRLDQLLGTLEKGKEANFCVFQLPQNTNAQNLYQNFFSSASKNIFTVSQGKILFLKN